MSGSSTINPLALCVTSPGVNAVDCAADGTRVNRLIAGQLAQTPVRDRFVAQHCLGVGERQGIGERVAIGIENFYFVEVGLIDDRFDHRHGCDIRWPIGRRFHNRQDVMLLGRPAPTVDGANTHTYGVPTSSTAGLQTISPVVESTDMPSGATTRENVGLDPCPGHWRQLSYR